MKQNFIISQIFTLYFLISSCTQAQQPDLSLNSTVNKTRIEKSLSIKFERPRALAYDWLWTEKYFLVPLQLDSEDVTIPVAISTKSGVIWINNYLSPSPNRNRFSCLLNRTSCDRIHFKNYRSNAEGIVTKEQVTIGERAFSNLSVFRVEHFSNPDGSPYLPGDIGMFGLDFQGSWKTLPNYEYFKREGLIEESFVSIRFQDHYEGELIFGGYPINKTKHDFRFVKMVDSYSFLSGGFRIPTRGMGFQNIAREGSETVTVDFETPYISLPNLEFNHVFKQIYQHKLLVPYPTSSEGSLANFEGISVNCSARDILEDVIIEFERFTLRIPASAYIISIKEYPLKRFNVDPNSESCFLTLVQTKLTDDRIVVGEPFFKVHDVIFDYRNRLMGFSPKYSMNITDKKIIEEKISNKNITNQNLPDKNITNQNTTNQNNTEKSMTYPSVTKSNITRYHVIAIVIASLVILECFFSIAIAKKFIKLDGKRENVGLPLQVFPKQTINIGPYNELNESNLMDETMN